MKVDELHREELYRGFFRLLRSTLRYQRFNGEMSDLVSLEVLERGDAVAVILYDPKEDVVGLIRQFRIGPYLRQESGWTIEIVAGSCGTQTDIESVARREVAEETGWSITTLEPIQTFYLSPSGSSERIHLFYGAFDSTIPQQGGGGLTEEGEEIEPLIQPFTTVQKWIQNQRFNSAIAILAMQWLSINRERLQQNS